MAKAAKGFLLTFIASVQCFFCQAQLIEMGRGSYGHPSIMSWGEGAVCRIGKYSSIADGVQIFVGGNHRVDWVTTFPFSALWVQAAEIVGHPSTKGDVIIGSDVWIGNGATIMSGVKIGDGAVIGAKAVVAKDVPAYAIAVGNPARVVKYRFTSEQIQKLLDIKWWEWPEDQILASMPFLLNSDIDLFIQYCENFDTK